MSEVQSSTVLQPTNRSMKAILNYNLAHGSTSMIKHVMNNNTVDMERYEEVVATTDVKGKKNARKGNM